MHPPASSSTCKADVKDCCLRRRRTSTDSKGRAARHNQICWVTQRIIISILFFVIGSRYVAEHLSVMHTAKIISTDTMSLTIKELCWLLMGKERQRRNAAPWLSSASFHDAASCKENSTSWLAQWSSRTVCRWPETQRKRERDRKTPNKWKTAGNSSS